MTPTSGHETNRRSSRRCRNKTVAHRDRINPRHDSASTTCVTIQRKHLGRDSPSACFLIRSCQTYLPPAQGRRGGAGTAPCAFPEERLHSAKQLQNGGGEWESNPPGIVARPRTDFEDQGHHQVPITSAAAWSPLPPRISQISSYRYSAVTASVLGPARVLSSHRGEPRKPFHPRHSTRSHARTLSRQAPLRRTATHLHPQHSQISLGDGRDLPGKTLLETAGGSRA